MKFLSGMAAALISTLALTAVSVDAAPMFIPKAQSAQLGVIQIRDGARWRHRATIGEDTARMTTPFQAGL